MSPLLVKAGRAPINTASLSPGTIQNLITNQGFILQAESAEVATMPGVQFVPGPGTPGFDPIPPLVPFGIPSSLQNIGTPPIATTRVPTGIVAPDIGKMMREGIEALWNNLTQGQDPVEGGLMRPEIGTTQVIPPGGFAPCRRNTRTPFIVMPNGLPGCPSGYHPEKQGKPYCVRNRRMNPLNPRALSRASRRVGGFARAVKRARTLKKVCKSL